MLFWYDCSTLNAMPCQPLQVGWYALHIKAKPIQEIYYNISPFKLFGFFLISMILLYQNIRDNQEFLQIFVIVNYYRLKGFRYSLRLYCLCQ